MLGCLIMLNKIILLGNLGRDPECQFTQQGSKFVKLSIVTTYKYKDKFGEKQEKLTWHKVLLFDTLAETALNYLKKGNLICVEGRVDITESKEGIKYYSVIASEFKMLT